MKTPKCDECGKDIQLDQGALSISFKEIREVEIARKAWEKEHSHNSFHAVADLLTYPESVRWKWRHYKCDGNSSYQIEADRLDTVEKVLHWTFHLMEKNWFKFTDWREAITRLYPGIY